MYCSVQFNLFKNGYNLNFSHFSSVFTIFVLSEALEIHQNIDGEVLRGNLCSLLLLVICDLYLTTSGAKSNQRHPAINEIGSNKTMQEVLLREALNNITSLHQQFLI